MASKSTSIRLAIEVTNWRGTYDKKPHWGAKLEPYENSYKDLTFESTTSQQDAVEQLENRVRDVLSADDPVVIYYADLVGIVSLHPRFGWSYSIVREQKPVDQGRCTSLSGDSKEETTKRLRRHMASNIGGLLGAELLTEASEVDDYFASESWHAGCRTVTRKFKSLDEVPHDTMEQARSKGDEARGRYRDWVRGGLSPQEAWEMVIDETSPIAALA